MSMRLQGARLAARALVLFALAYAPVAAGAQQAPAKFRAIKVDVSHLVEKGLGPEAEWIAADLPGRLQTAFAGRFAPGAAAAPTLLVRIDLVTLGDSGGGGTQPFGGIGARDEIQGVALVVAPGGRTVASFPLFTSQINFTGGSVYERGTERRRVAELASSFAQWLPSQMGL